jgi:hypothetical protein
MENVKMKLFLKVSTTKSKKKKSCQNFIFNFNKQLK